MSEEPEFAFGTLSADRPDAQRLNRKRFRIALLGDFSGRAARGLLETGDALADHRDHGIWLGTGLELDLSIFA